MTNNLYSLGLLRNGKVYASKQLAIQGLTQSATNDGVAKLARYLDPVVGGDPIIRTLVGFYANALEMEDAGGGQSSYTILDIDGNASDVEQIREEITAINNIIGSGIGGETLTDAINDINDKLGEGFSENHTVADALSELENSLKDSLEVTIDDETSSSEYIIKQGGVEIGRIKKDVVVERGSVVHGTWVGDTFIEDPEGEDTAIKLEFINGNIIYINTKDLIDVYTAGDGIFIANNVVSIKYNAHSEDFLVVDGDGIRVEGIQAAIDEKADDERLYGSDGISIASNMVKAVASKFSVNGIKNPISVEKDGIKFDGLLDCGFFDSVSTGAKTVQDIDKIANPSDTDVFIDGDGAMDALTTNKVFKSLKIANVEAEQQVYLSAVESISLDDVEVTGDKGSTNGYFLFNSPVVELSNIMVVDGAKPYNVFEGQGNSLKSFKASNIKVDDVSLKHNVFNIYHPKNDAVISISDSNFNMDVNKSNVLRLANYGNATGVTVEFENVEWTYENTPNKDIADWDWAGLVIYQPSSTDEGLSGNLTAMKTWEFKFKNCKYNGKKINGNNFGQKNQVFYLYNVGNTGDIIDPIENGFNVSFE